MGRRSPGDWKSRVKQDILLYALGYAAHMLPDRVCQQGAGRYMQVSIISARHGGCMFNDSEALAQGSCQIGSPFQEQGPG
jgi:hypothetical protein